jgi:hypothetical protein
MPVKKGEHTMKRGQFAEAQGIGLINQGEVEAAALAFIQPQ